MPKEPERAGVNQARAKMRINARFIFAGRPETQIHMNANIASCLLDVQLTYLLIGVYYTACSVAPKLSKNG